MKKAVAWWLSAVVVLVAGMWFGSRWSSAFVVLVATAVGLGLFTLGDKAYSRR